MHAAFAVAAFGCLVSAVGAFTPIHSDARAYATAIGVVEPNFENARDDTATDRFFEIQARYETLRYPLLDAGFTVMAWGVFAAAAISRGQTERWVRATESKRALAVATAASIVIVWFGLMVWNVLLLERQLLPWWGDSVVIGMFEFTVLILISAPFLFGLAMWPAFSKGRPNAPLLGGPIIHVGGLIYLVLAALFLLVAVRSAIMGGGWAISLGTGIIAWLLLNARALMLAPKVPA